MYFVFTSFWNYKVRKTIYWWTMLWNKYVCTFIWGSFLLIWWIIDMVSFALGRCTMFMASCCSSLSSS
jgi:hypothetical protein